VLGANLHPSVPVDRHVFVKRMRVWANADGFLSPLDAKESCVVRRQPQAVWQFIANAGDGRTVEIELRAKMLQEKTRRFLVSAGRRQPGARQTTPAGRRRAIDCAL